jgi:DNA adenine methylase
MDQVNSSQSRNLDQVVNVSQVRHRSPFRYPGGKTWLVPRIQQWLAYRKPVAEFVEPFAGGAIVSLTAVFGGLTEHATLIELDPKVAAVWQVILQSSDSDVQWLVDRILHFPMDRASVETLLSRPAGSTREQAFLTVLKNRVNHGGCLAEGAGLLRNGENGKGIRSRWYPETIAKRIKDIQLIRNHITFLQEDGIAYMERHAQQGNALFFVDPPYWVAGTRLYDFSELDHSHLFDVMHALQGDWLITYDNAPEIVGYAQAHQFETRLISMQNKNHATQRELLVGRSLDWLIESPAEDQQLRLINEKRTGYRTQKRSDDSIA